LENSEVPISYEDFKGGYGIFTFNLTPDNDACSDHVSEPSAGVIKCLADFSASSTKPLMLLFIMEAEKTILIDRDYNVCVM
jgi:hypothetical protein